MFEIVSDAAGSEVKFDEHGDGLARYEILNFRKSEHNGTNGYQYQASESTFFVIRNFFFFYVFSPLSIEQKFEGKFTFVRISRRIFLLLSGSNEERGERIIVGGSLEPVWRTAINCNNPVGELQLARLNFIFHAIRF